MRNFFISLLLMLTCLFSVSCTKNKMDFSRRYVPIYNPGGDAFYSNRDFVKSYTTYEKRRDFFINRINQENKNTENNQHMSEQDIVDKLHEYGVVELSGNSGDMSSANVDNPGSIVNSSGIDLSLLQGARFIEVDDSSWGPTKNISGSRSWMSRALNRMKSTYAENLSKFDSAGDSFDDGDEYYLQGSNTQNNEQKKSTRNNSLSYQKSKINKNVKNILKSNERSNNTTFDLGHFESYDLE